MSRQPDALIFGAGALALGFLGPELYKDWALTFIDIDAKKELLLHLKDNGKYTVNIAGPFQKAFEVTNVRGLNLNNPPELKEIIQRFNSSPLIFTSVGAANLNSLVPIFREGLNSREKAKSGAIYILCCENGRDIAMKFHTSLEVSLNRRLTSECRIGDTVMGRMCRVEPDIENNKHLEPVYEGANWAVVAEPFFGFPIKRGLIKEEKLFKSPFQLKEDNVFEALEDIKFFAHNGCHAFLGYIGFLKGYRYFGELKEDRNLMGLAYEMLFNETGKALITKHEIIDRSDYENYATNLLRRLTCPSFNDSIDRAVRRPLEKLGPDERLISGARFILSQGIRPRIYTLAIAAAIKACVNNKEISSDNIDNILLTYCKLTPEKDAVLIELIKNSYEEIMKGQWIKV
ncbi:MAG: hypothetical protein HYV48_04495 [Candidatus Omnitrophica bacterium]|nr:hypothetical protein [Candidatus Omnitrophota bacterium]